MAVRTSIYSRPIPSIRVALGILVAVCCTEGAVAAPLAPPANRAATLTPLTQHAVLEAVTRAGKRLVAVGAHGAVLLSDDDGRVWRQVSTPVSVTLTAVQFVDGKHGWAVGHSGVILATQDGGEHWTRQLEGEGAAHLVLAEAKGLPVPDAKVLASAKRFVVDGADKPFLSLNFSDALHGTAVGAYGLAVHTDDGGKTWQSWTARIGNRRGLHLYAVSQQGDVVWIAGEQGFVARSTDRGEAFTLVQTPYKGSFFALAVDQAGTVVLAGLRGNAFRSADRGASFESLKLDGPITLTDVVHTANGTWLLANQAGQVFVSRDGAKSFVPQIAEPQVPLNGIALNAHGGVTGVGFGGAAEVVGALTPVSALTRGESQAAAVDQ